MKTIDTTATIQLNTQEESKLSLQDKCALLTQQLEELSAKLKWYEEQFLLS